MKERAEAARHKKEAYKGFLVRSLRVFGRERNGVILPGDALLNELDQSQRKTLVVRQPAERHVQDAQDRRKIGLVL